MLARSRPPGARPAGRTTATSDWLITAPPPSSDTPRSPECPGVLGPLVGAHHIVELGVTAAGAEAAFDGELYRGAEEQHVHRDRERRPPLDDVARRRMLPAQAEVQVDRDRDDAEDRDLAADVDESSEVR